MPDPTSASVRPAARVGRRALIAASVPAGLLLTGCDLGGHGDGGAGGPTPADGVPSATITPAGDPDRRIVDAARRDLSTLHASLSHAARDADPVLRADLEKFAALHARHAHALGGLTRERHVPLGPTTAAALATAESLLQKRLRVLARQAASGAVAALLASMVAALAQRLTPTADGADVA